MFPVSQFVFQLEACCEAGFSVSGVWVALSPTTDSQAMRRVLQNAQSLQHGNCPARHRKRKETIRMSEKDWWKTVFDQRYLDTYLADFTPERTRQEVDFIAKAAQLQPADAILDLACGHGRHAIELAKRGFSHVTGLDYSEPFIKKAKADAEQAKASVRFLRGDMKELPFKREFDTVLLLFTAFGYFDDASNKAVLRQIQKALKPNGRFLIDVVSGEIVQERFGREGVRDESNGQLSIPRQAEMGGTVIDEIEWFDEQNQIVHTHRAWEDNGEKKEYDYWLHVYTMPQYQKMLEEAGFNILQVWGDHKGAPHRSAGTSRTIILAKKVNAGSKE